MCSQMLLLPWSRGFRICHPRFFAKHLDSDLSCMVERTVPPIQLQSISNFRTLLAKYQRKVRCIIVPQVLLTGVLL